MVQHSSSRLTYYSGTVKEAYLGNPKHSVEVHVEDPLHIVVIHFSQPAGRCHACKAKQLSCVRLEQYFSAPRFTTNKYLRCRQAGQCAPLL